MNSPSPAASHRYSGQCRRAAPSILRPALLQELGHEAGPAGLMAGADTGAVVAVEILVEQRQVSPVRVAPEELEAPVHGPASILVDEEDADQPAGQLGGYV